MIPLFLAVSAVAAVLILPGWFWARKRGSRNFWLLLLPLYGVCFWSGLAALRIGPQSLANIIEVPIVTMGAIAAAYLKIFALDVHLKNPTYGTAIAYALVGSIALGLRLFMPFVPE